ncbi:HNH endonuclease [Hymenobacter sp. BT175]|uniref:YDG/SRA domain-containing protein n=1 Tax=Hymenobacter translucens TaxID=2886507 RepID=UPI001D0DEF7C|nr:YDG/SRA domain-containing protein [Hymenobacter translucens]MCC2546902.1 HNH endonuclease [Hymenobacter translucens]
MAGTFGHVGTARAGDLFASRLELSLRGLHRPRQAGICATQAAGAESIVLSEKYEDDEIHDDYLLYTGHGGRDQNTGKQAADQTLTDANLGLYRSQVTGRPVRVFRKVASSGEQRFRYEGLFRVVSTEYRQGKSGFMVYRFRLEPLVESGPEQGPRRTYSLFDEAEQVHEPAPRYLATTSRIIRDTALTRAVKDLYAYRCQVCNERLPTPAGFYAEAAHIRPLGAPHHGPDLLSNVLCLCPNHHVLFDFGSIAVNEDFTLLGLPGRLTVQPAHQVGLEFLAYHRAHIYLAADRP